MQINTFPAECLLGLLNEIELKNAPEKLYVLGHIGLLEAGSRVSLVGSRKASRLGLGRAEKLAAMLTAENAVIVSGLAFGIDKAAHTAAIDAGGKTVAVIGTPLDKYYPSAHKSLQDLIAREHLLISQFAVGSRTYPSCFPQRNRTMALISDATVIVEAQNDSGSLHQGWEALRLGRPLFICRELLEDKSLSWTADLMRYGATPIATDENGIECLLADLPVRYGNILQGTHVELPC